MNKKEKNKNEKEILRMIENGYGSEEKINEREVMKTLVNGNAYYGKYIKVPYTLMGMPYKKGYEEYYIWDTQVFNNVRYTALMSLYRDENGEYKKRGIDIFEIPRDENGNYTSLLKLSGDRLQSVYRKFCDFYGYTNNSER